VNVIQAIILLIMLQEGGANYHSPGEYATRRPRTQILVITSVLFSLFEILRYENLC
jgi:hypothetical protein